MLQVAAKIVIIMSGRMQADERLQAGRYVPLDTMLDSDDDSIITTFVTGVSDELLVCTTCCRAYMRHKC